MVLSEPNLLTEETGMRQKVGIWGMSGIGKSVLATCVAQDEEIIRRFPDGVFWITVGQDPKLTFQQLQLAKALGVQQGNFENEQQGKNYLKRLLTNKACLIILDDVWHVKHATALDALGTRCQMLITSQDVEGLRFLGAREHPVEKLDDLQAWELLAQWVKTDTKLLPPEAGEVANQCGNLPLALSLCGAMVRDGTSWADLQDALYEADLNFIEKQQFRDYSNPNVLKALKVSVDALAKEDADCAKYYQELAVFSAAEPVLEVAVWTLWLRDGNIKERHARKWLNRLESRSLLQIERHQSRVKLHSLQYKYLLAIQDDLPSLHNQLLEAYRRKSSGAWFSVPSDGYFFQHLGYHLVAAGRINELQQLQFDFIWLQAKLDATDVSSAIADFDFFPNDKASQLVQKTLRRSAHILVQDKKQLAGQLIGRLLSYQLPKIQAMLEQAKQQRTGCWLRPLTASLMSPEGLLARNLTGHDSLVKAVAVTSDGKYAVSATDSHLKVWDLKRGFELRTWNHFTWKVEAMAITPDGQCAVIASYDFDCREDILEIFDLESGSTVRTWAAHEFSIKAVALTPDGLNIISCSIDRTIKIWDFASGEELRTLEGHTRTVSAVAVTPDGQYVISACEDGTLKVWDFYTGTELRTLEGHSDIVTSVAAGPEGKIVSGSWDRTVIVWDLETGNELHTFTGHAEWVLAVAITPNGQYAISASNDSTLKVWNLEDDSQPPRILIGHTTRVVAVAVTPDGKNVISGSWDYTLKVWDLEGKTGRDNPIAHTGAIRGVAIAPDGKYVISASNDMTLKIWSLEDQKELRTLVGHTNSITSVAITPDGQKIISAAHDETMKIWDFKSGLELKTLTGHTEGVKAIAITPDGKNVLSTSLDGTILIWDLQKGNTPRCLPISDKDIGVIAVTTNGKRAVFGYGKQDLKVWDLEKDSEVFTLKGHSSYIETLAITPNGKYVISAASAAVKVWELITGKEVKSFYHHSASVTEIAVSPNSKHVLSTGRDHALKIWDIESGVEITMFYGDSAIFCCAVAIDGTTIVAGEASGRLHFLRLENLKSLTTKTRKGFSSLLGKNQPRQQSSKNHRGFGQ
jgi:WD40 repeat protein